MDQDAALLRAMVRWSAHYEPAWDAQPARYLDEGIVQWGRSRRLGRLQRGDLKAYIGIQHVDPTKSGWGSLRSLKRVSSSRSSSAAKP